MRSWTGRRASSKLLPHAQLHFQLHPHSFSSTSGLAVSGFIQAERGWLVHGLCEETSHSSTTVAPRGSLKVPSLLAALGRPRQAASPKPVPKAKAKAKLPAAPSSYLPTSPKTTTTCSSRIRRLYRRQKHQKQKGTCSLPAGSQTRMVLGGSTTTTRPSISLSTSHLALASRRRHPCHHPRDRISSAGRLVSRAVAISDLPALTSTALMPTSLRSSATSSSRVMKACCRMSRDPRRQGLPGSCSEVRQEPEQESAPSSLNIDVARAWAGRAGKSEGRAV